MPRLERALRRDRAVTLAAVALMAGLAWFWVAAGAGMPMTAAMMTRTGLFPHLGGAGIVAMTMSGPGPSTPVGAVLLAASMWWVMMVAMMLPSATPMLLLHAGVVRQAQVQGRMAAGAVPTGAFLAGYLAVWAGFALAAAAVQTGLSATPAFSAMMLWSQSRWLSAGVLAAAALYQITPLRRACLARCRSPAEWLAGHFRPGSGGSFRMGLAHGAHCLGCCAGLMALLFVGGVMNLVWIAALSLLILFEKLLPPRVPSGRVSALLLAIWAVATLTV